MNTARLRRKLIEHERGSASDDGCVGFSQIMPDEERVFAPWRLCVRSILHAVGDARDAVLDESDIEIDKQAQALVRQSQMRQ